jgi:hypothetical protein
MTPGTNRTFLPIIILFIVFNAVFLLAKNILSGWGAELSVLIFGNLLLFVVSLASFFITKQGLRAKNTHAFVRSVYGSIMIKFFVCLGAVFIYAMDRKAGINKPALFICFGLYIVYTIIEVSALMKLLKQKTNA